MDSIIVFVAKYFLVISVIITLWFWLKSATDTKIELAARLIVGGVIALAISNLASRAYYDPRPFVTQHVTPLFTHAADNGFPSDHALFTSFLAFTIVKYSKKVGAVLLVIAVLVGTARVSAHVHNPQDIIGSFVFSALAALVAAWLVDKLRLATRWRHTSSPPA